MTKARINIHPIFIGISKFGVPAILLFYLLLSFDIAGKTLRKGRVLMANNDVLIKHDAENILALLSSGVSINHLDEKSGYSVIKLTFSNLVVGKYYYFIPMYHFYSYLGTSLGKHSSRSCQKCIKPRANVIPF